MANANSMYVVTTSDETSETLKYVSMIATNIVYTDSNIQKAIIVSNEDLATSLKEIVSSFDTDNVYVAKSVTLIDVQTETDTEANTDTEIGNDE